MLKINIESEVEVGGEVEERLPLINQNKLSDNPSEEKVRWLFLKDVQNKFVVKGKWWLLKRITYKPQLQREWFKDVKGDYLY